MTASLPTNAGARAVRRLLTLVACASIVATSVTAIEFPSASSAAPASTFTLGVPAYFSDDASWARLLATPGLSHIVIASYWSGIQDSMRGHISAAAAKGIRTLGYAHAGFAPAGSPNSTNALSQQQLQESVNLIMAMYPSLTGIFLDEIQNTFPCEPSWAQFYVDFAAWFRVAHPGKLLALNPGGPLCSSFSGAADVYVVAERSMLAYNDPAATAYYSNSAFDWIRALADEQVWVVNYAVPESALPAQLPAMRTVLGAGVIWATAAPTTNDYAALPTDSYLCALSLAAVGSCASDVGPTTTTTLAPTPTSTTVPTPTTATPNTISRRAFCVGSSKGTGSGENIAAEMEVADIVRAAPIQGERAVRVSRGCV